MPEDHPYARITRQLWAAVADGDSEALEQVLAPDVHWQAVGRNRVAGEYHGPAAVMEYLATIGEIADQFTSTLGEVYVGADGAVAIHHVNARRGDKTLEMEYIIRFVIHDDRVASAISVPIDQRKNDAFWS